VTCDVGVHLAPHVGIPGNLEVVGLGEGSFVEVCVCVFVLCICVLCVCVCVCVRMYVNF
jgi:hypothetical protein